MGFPGYVKKHGPSYNYFQTVTVNWAAFGGGSTDGYGCDLFIPFVTQGFILINQSGGSVDYSFDGVNLHGQLDGTNGLLTKLVHFDNRVVDMIWFRGSSQTVSLQAWAVR